jgi:hypothetical protein
MNEAVKNIVDELADKDLEAIMVVGLDSNGSLNIQSSVNNVALMHWMLNKSIFDINVFENNQKREEKTEKAEE